MSNSSPMLKICGLWKRTSQKGSEYFCGRMGGVKVLVLANTRRETDSDPSHFLFFDQAEDKSR